MLFCAFNRRLSLFLRARFRQSSMANINLSPMDNLNQELLDNVHPADWQNPEPEDIYNLVVIGAGAAGLISAAAAAGLGGKVALIDDTTKTLKLPIIANGQNDVSIFDGQHLIGCNIGMLVAQSLRTCTCRQIVHRLVGQRG